MIGHFHIQLLDSIIFTELRVYAVKVLSRRIVSEMERAMAAIVFSH